MKVLYIGGTGEISYACVGAGAAAGQEIFVFNRGRNDEPLPAGVHHLPGDLADDAAYRQLARPPGGGAWDAVCQFKAYDLAAARRDADVFGGGNCGQYVFISSASAYQKPMRSYVITEDVPLENPFWAYSRAKAEMEAYLMGQHRAGRLPVTIVRPSHTYRRNFPTALGGGDNVAWRILHGKPVIVHGDGTSLWTITHADDFARPFVKLLGNPAALGEAFHLTAHLQSHAWDQILHAVGAALGREPDLVHVPSETLARYHGEWAGGLLGDKAWSVLFDNTKVKRVAGEFECKIGPGEGMRRVAEHYRRRSASHAPDEKFHALMDRIAADQRRLGTMGDEGQPA